LVVFVGYALYTEDKFRKKIGTTPKNRATKRPLS